MNNLLLNYYYNTLKYFGGFITDFTVNQSFKFQQHVLKELSVRLRKQLQLKIIFTESEGFAIFQMLHATMFNKILRFHILDLLLAKYGKYQHINI